MGRKREKRKKLEETMGFRRDALSQEEEETTLKSGPACTMGRAYPSGIECPTCLPQRNLWNPKPRMEGKTRHTLWEILL